MIFKKYHFLALETVELFVGNVQSEAKKKKKNAALL